MRGEKELPISGVGVEWADVGGLLWVPWCCGPAMFKLGAELQPLSVGGSCTSTADGPHIE